jgi:hypothetical protein
VRQILNALQRWPASVVIAARKGELEKVVPEGLNVLVRKM